ncbi:NUDIX domain-containing protein [Xylariales sp. AK1849]|nr:NUDIX domain-containing protein [Xylariales sp. AK1849]
MLRCVATRIAFTSLKYSNDKTIYPRLRRAVSSVSQQRAISLISTRIYSRLGQVPHAHRRSHTPARPLSKRYKTILAPGSMTKASHYSTGSASKDQKPPVESRPSSSVILLSPANQVLLLHRVKTSSTFPSAHVFPGGNLSDFHDGPVPPPGDPTRHEDSKAYRLGAIRETFEESGILLARHAGGNDGKGTALLDLSPFERDKARKAIHANEVQFEEWLESVGGVADIENLHPFTRWITPAATPRRFTTQMYLYMLPLQSPHNSSAVPDLAAAAAESDAVVPTPDGDEVTTSVFEEASTWLERQSRGDIILFPPQAFLLTLISQFCNESSSNNASPSSLVHYQAQRASLLTFLDTVPTASHPKSISHPSSQIPWAEKVISPSTALVRDDGRVVLSLEKPGPELKDTARGGDRERVVLVRFARGTATEVEVRGREEIFDEVRGGFRANF